MKPFKERKEHSENELRLGGGWGKVMRTKCTVTSGGFSSEKASGAGLNFKTSSDMLVTRLSAWRWGLLPGYEAGTLTVSTKQKGAVGWGEDSNSWNPPSSKRFLPFRQSRTRTETLCRADRNLVQWNGMWKYPPVYVSQRAICCQPPCFWKVTLLSQPPLLPETQTGDRCPLTQQWTSTMSEKLACEMQVQGFCQRLCRAVARPHSYRMF